MFHVCNRDFLIGRNSLTSIRGQLLASVVNQMVDPMQRRIFLLLTEDGTLPVEMGNQVFFWFSAPYVSGKIPILMSIFFRYGLKPPPFWCIPSPFLNDSSSKPPKTHTLSIAAPHNEHIWKQSWSLWQDWGCVVSSRKIVCKWWFQRTPCLSSQF